MYADAVVEEISFEIGFSTVFSWHNCV